MIYDKIALMLPTYGRSDTYLPTFINSAIDTALDKDSLVFVFCVNADDAATIKFLKEYKFGKIPNIRVFEKLPTPNLAKYFNMMYDTVNKLEMPEMVVTMLGDDMEFKTQGWDRIVLAEINAYKGLGVFWCNDDYISRERCPVNLFVTQRMVKATQHLFMCEEFEGDMIDWLWGKIGKYTRTSHFLPNVIIKHNHNTAKPESEWDETYKRLVPAQQAGHRVGKPRARQIAAEIAEILKAKGIVGESIC